MLFSHSHTARRLGVLALFVAASFGSLTAWLGSTYAFPPPGGGGGSPPANPAIAFTGTGGSGYTLRVMNADGTNATTIYNFPSGNFVNKVSWSPGGGSIAFMDGWSVCRIDVSVVNGVPVGSNHVVLVASGTGAAYTSPAWSPLGDEIAFVHVQSHSLMTVPSPGGTPQTIYTPPPGTLIVNYLAWSPDGAFIAFWEDGGGQGDNTIRILERATGQVTTALGPSDVGVGDLDWARTQDALVFVGDPDGGYYTGIWLLSLSQGGSLQFIRDAHAASWSPDDSQLVITSGSGVTKLERLNLATGAVTSLGSKGSRPDWRRF